MDIFIPPINMTGMNAKQRKTSLAIAFGTWARHCNGVNKIISTLSTNGKWTAIFAGAISATGFAPLNLWPLTLIAFAILLHLAMNADTGKQAFWRGWAFGVGHFCVGLNWIAGSFRYQDAMPVWLGWVAVFLLSLFLAVFPALTTLATWRMVRAITPAKNIGITTLPFAFSGFWIITEWFRSWVFTGFAWNPLGAVTLSPHMAGGAIWVGTYGLSAFVILSSGGLLLACHRKWRGVVLAVAPIIVITLPTAMISTAPAPANGPHEITIVQPNIGQQDKYELGYDALNFQKLAELSRPLPGQGPRLLLWPEAAIPDYLEDGYPKRYYQFQTGESAAGARFQLAGLLGNDDILMTGVNRLIINDDGQLTAARNSVSVVDANARLIGHYDKAHLVPYGEYLALRWLLEPLGATRLVPGNLDFIPGPGPRSMTLPNFGTTGIQICYEIIFSGQVVDRKNRPDFIFNPSNDAWFGDWGPPQHFAQGRLRAIEEGLPVIRSTPTGISGIIDAGGRVVASIPLGQGGRIDAKIPVAHAPTLFSQHGNILPLGFGAILLLFALLPVVRRRGSG